MDIKSKIDSLKKTRDSLKDELRSLEYEKSKLEEEISSLEGKVVELFETTDVSVLTQKSDALKSELMNALKECESFLNASSCGA